MRSFLTFFVFVFFVVNGAVRLNGEAKRSSRPTSLKTLPAFTHGHNWHCTAARSLPGRGGKGLFGKIGSQIGFLVRNQDL